jgi:hypothetical protein
MTCLPLKLGHCHKGLHQLFRQSSANRAGLTTTVPALTRTYSERDLSPI